VAEPQYTTRGPSDRVIHQARLCRNGKGTLSILVCPSGGGGRERPEAACPLDAIDR